MPNIIECMLWLYACIHCLPVFRSSVPRSSFLLSYVIPLSFFRSACHSFFIVLFLSLAIYLFSYIYLCIIIIIILYFQAVMYHPVPCRTSGRTLQRTSCWVYIYILYIVYKSSSIIRVPLITHRKNGMEPKKKNL